MIRRGHEKGGLAARGEQSWRELAGPRKGRVQSRQARQRRRMKFLKLALGVCVLLGVTGGLLFGVRWWQESEPVQREASTNPVERIHFSTDGVLPNSWLRTVIDLQPGMPLMEVDIHGMKRDMEEAGQVKWASVRRNFPAELRIRVRERTPVMRLATERNNGERRLRLVARDGTVYEGFGYPDATIRRLPFLIPYQHSDGSYLPLRGIETVAELLDLVRKRSPELYISWRVVSLENYSGNPELPGEVIEMRSKEGPRILFGASGGFGKQLDRLLYILEQVPTDGDPSVVRIDLSLRGAAAVQFNEERVRIF
ncbi:MAG: cell division protein FtsQ/DivIB [Opitutales bacterium]